MLTIYVGDSHIKNLLDSNENNTNYVAIALPGATSLHISRVMANVSLLIKKWNVDKNQIRIVFYVSTNDLLISKMKVKRPPSSEVILKKLNSKYYYNVWPRVNYQHKDDLADS